MTAADRRTVLRLAMAAAVTPLAGSLLAAPAGAQALSGGLVDPPATPMIYRRELVRDTADGNAVRVARTFTVRFVRVEAGFVLHGEQSSVEVAMPEALAALAARERARVETTMFPITLDAFGRIRSDAGHGRWGSEIERAFGDALAMIGAQATPAAERDMLRDFVSAIHVAGQGIVAHLPPDLFAPDPAPREEMQTIALPGGGVGSVSTHFDGQKDQATGLMNRAVREIATEAEGLRRTTREMWSLTNA